MAALPSLIELALAAGVPADEIATLAAAHGVHDPTASTPYPWRAVARPAQLAPSGAWRLWLLLAGRGFGKGRSAAEWIREEVDAGVKGPWHLIGATAADVRDVMIGGSSGLQSVWAPRLRPLYEPSKRRLTFHTGEYALCFSSEEPDRLRGPQCTRLWADEIAAWYSPDETLDMALFGLRLGSDPRGVVTTTPRPTEIVRRLVKDPTVAVARGSTYDNRANLAPAFFEQIIKRYEGTRLGRQELLGEILEDVDNALWTHAMLDALRVAEAPPMTRIVVGVDPSGYSGEDHDAQGIAKVGLGGNGHLYVLTDATGHYTPDGWGRMAVDLASDADCIVVETNFGGEMASHVITSAAKAMGRVVRVVTTNSSRGKHIRAEPIAGVAEQGRYHHVGVLEHLEDEMVQATPGGYLGGRSPNRLDAMVFAATELLAGDPRVIQPDNAPRVLPAGECWD